MVLLLWPLSGALSLTLVLIVFFVIEGAASIMFALEHKRELSGRWGWMLASGIIDLILAAIIFVGLPSTAAWAIGLLVGIDMVFNPFGRPHGAREAAKARAQGGRGRRKTSGGRRRERR
jgi:uncharacterized membrane protein HdeD (DUF308 family)